MHLMQGDRHYAFAGEGRMVLYDGRDDSPTHGQVAQVHFSDVSRGVVYIPPGVWHAAHNTGDSDWQIINFPSAYTTARIRTSSGWTRTRARSRSTSRLRTADAL